MTAAALLKGLVALGILAVVVYTFRNGQSWWWRMPKSTRVIFAAFAVLFITAAGFFYQSQKGELSHGNDPARGSPADASFPRAPLP